MGAYRLLLALFCLTFLPAASAAAAKKPVSPVEKAARAFFAEQLEQIEQIGADGAPFGHADTFLFADTDMAVGPVTGEDLLRGFQGAAGSAGPIKTVKLRVTTAADGRAAWLVATLRVMQYNPGDGPGFWVDYRVTELIVEHEGGYNVAAAYWSSPRADKEVNAWYAKNGLGDPMRVAAGDADEGEAEIAELVGGALRGKTFADLIDERGDLVVLGTAPKEEVVGGKKWKKSWAAWSDKIELLGGVKAGLSPHGGTAWAVATFAIEKTPKAGAAYKIPFRLFLVLDKTAAGWKVVHAHLAVAQ
jgi:ketosteroid isomerase-like protein